MPSRGWTPCTRFRTRRGDLAFVRVFPTARIGRRSATRFVPGRDGRARFLYAQIDGREAGRKAGAAGPGGVVVVHGTGVNRARGLVHFDLHHGVRVSIGSGWERGQVEVMLAGCDFRRCRRFCGHVFLLVVDEGLGVSVGRVEIAPLGRVAGVVPLEGRLGCRFVRSVIGQV
uniref:(northern house mosquito) hypothetical protein n=1 Tax=Culex pipiens TaxID=7175 RepID=A0A8D8FBG9_CULPI